MPGGLHARRVVKAYRQTIEGAPARVFPLLCPVREEEWLDGWAYRMVYSASGLVEPGAVFTTSAPGEADTVWVVSRHEPAQGVVEFCRFTAASRTCLLRIVVSALDGQRSSVDVCYEHTSLSPAGETFLDGVTDDAFLGAMRFWEASMNHFLTTGTRLARGTAVQVTTGDDAS